MTPHRGKLIVFEGLDGVGKGEMVSRALDSLKKSLGEDAVVYSKDPGSTPLGSKIRDILFKDPTTKGMACGVLDLLFLASHIQNWKTIVKPALESGKVVVSDRWWYSQMAYLTQRPCPCSIIDAYEDCKGWPADLMIMMVGDVNEVFARAQNRVEGHQESKEWNDLYKLDQIQKAYVRQFSKRAEYREVDVTGKSKDEVWSAISHLLTWELIQWSKE